MTAAAADKLASYPDRISRADAIAIVNRGGDYPVHAAHALTPSGYRTGCGRWLVGVNHHPATTRVSCLRCRRFLALTADQ